MKAVAIKNGQAQEKAAGFREMGTLQCDGCGEEFILACPMDFPANWKITRRRRTELFRLQLHQDSSYTSRIVGYGSWRDRSTLGCGRLGYSLGSLGAAEGGKSGAKTEACDTKARSNKCKMNGQMSVEAVSS